MSHKTPTIMVIVSSSNSFMLAYSCSVVWRGPRLRPPPEGPPQGPGRPPGPPQGPSALRSCACLPVMRSRRSDLGWGKA